jgi:16S rRNA (cytidine1402-2'-O)-methyltransferase
MLYLVATPIGNLDDLTFRAVEVLNACRYILCEDTRHTQHLVQHYQIPTRLVSYHQFNEKEREEEIIADLKQGLQITLVSDAGTPGICDPGHRLVKRCKEENLPVTVIPGPCAAISALVLSGQETDRFQFVGFLPKKESELKELFAEIFYYSGTSIAYESPHRLLDTLKLLTSLSPEKNISIARELTKIHEECLSGTAQELLSHFHEHPPKGEIVLLFSGNKTPLFNVLSSQEQVSKLQKEFDLPLSTAIKIAAKLYNMPKRILYKETITHH